MNKINSIAISGNREQGAGSRVVVRYILAFFLLCLIHFNLFSQNTVFPRLDPDPAAFGYYQTAKSNYTWQELAEMSLWASTGNPVEPNNASLQRIIAITETIKKSEDFPSGEVQQAEYILTYLHRNVLKTYTLLQSRIDTIFSTGRYNCVSSSVLYTIICKSFGINTAGVITKDHAFVVVYADSRSIDVETTNRYGFDPGNRKEFHDQFGRVTGFSYVPPQNYRDRQTINQIELVSLILNNRISEHEKQSRFADPVPIAIDRTVLLLGANPSAQDNIPADALFKDPYKELTDKLINYGGMLLRNNREEDAILWAVTASKKYPESPRWQELFFTSINNRTVRYLRANQVTEARTFFDSHKQHLTQENYKKVNLSLIDAELLRSATGITNISESEACIAAITQALSKNELSKERAQELQGFAIQKTASILSSGNNFRSAIQYLEASIKKYGTSRELEQALRTYRNALAVDYHNRFASEWNKGNHAEAERILNEGLKEFPDNRQLLNNKATVERQKRN